jgi:small subunit ribosomal protein S5
MSKFLRKGETSEFDQRVLEIRRVTRVVAGGKRFNFRTAIVLGNKKGKVGVGIGKGADVSMSIDKAVRDAKKNMKIVLMKDKTIPHEVSEKYKSVKLFIKPAPKGSGIIAGGALRAVCELAGIENISAKVLSKGSNKVSVARAAISALSKLKNKKQQH